MLLFRHWLHVVYQKAKCGVDGAVKFRAGSRSPSSTFICESKVVTKNLKRLVENYFLAFGFIQDVVRARTAVSSFDLSTIFERI